MSTWLNLVEKKKPAWAEGMTKRELLAARSDPEKARWGVSELANENAPILKKAGVPVTDGNLYLAHFSGPEAAVRVLKAKPDTPAYMLYGLHAVRANRKVLAGKKAKDIIAWAEKKVA